MKFNTNQQKRMFYINSKWGKCDMDEGWIMVVYDKGTALCSWESMYITQVPLILYSPLSSRAI